MYMYADPVVVCIQWWYVSSGGMYPVVVCIQWWDVSSGGMYPVVVCIQWWDVSSGGPDDVFILSLEPSSTSIPCVCE